jgi:hypothetical protein
MRMAKRTRVSALLLVLVLVFGTPMVATLIAWEEDVHYVLTFWLATQAGFSFIQCTQSRTEITLEREIRMSVKTAPLFQQENTI